MLLVGAGSDMTSSPPAMEGERKELTTSMIKTIRMIGLELFISILSNLCYASTMGIYDIQSIYIIRLSERTWNKSRYFLLVFIKRYITKFRFRAISRETWAPSLPLKMGLKWVHFQ